MRPADAPPRPSVTRLLRCLVALLVLTLPAAAAASATPASAATAPRTASPDKTVASVTAAVSPSAQTRAATSVSAESGVVVTLDEVSPVSPKPGDQLVVRGTVRNASATKLEGARVRLRVSRTPLQTRSQVADIARGRTVRTGSAVPGSSVDLPDVLPAGGRSPFSISVPVDSLGLDGFGVYPLDVEVRGTLVGGAASGGSTASTGDQTQALLPTFLPWSPPGSSYSPSSVVWLWPLTATPTRGPQGQVLDPTALAESLQPSGRLGRIVNAGAGSAVTWVVDPNLLQTVGQVAAGAGSPGTGGTSGVTGTPGPSASSGPTASATGSTEPSASPTGSSPSNGGAGGTASFGSQTGSAGGGQASSPAGSGGATSSPSASPSPAPLDPSVQTAASWLSSLRTAIASQSVMLTPYADPDLAAVHRAGRDDDLRSAIALGRQLGSQLLGVPVNAGVAWPADGLLPPSLVPTLAQLGMSGVVLSPKAKPQTTDLTYTPTGRAVVGSGSSTLDGYIYDPTLTSLVMAGDLQHPDTAARPLASASATSTAPLTSGQQTLLVQEFLADTALLTAERPSVPRTVLIAPDRGWDPSLVYATRLLQAVQQAPWVKLAPMSRLASAPVDSRVQRSGLTYPASAQRAELPQTYLGAIGDLQQQVSTVSSILTRPEQVVPAYRQALLELESLAWRSRPDQRVQATGAVADSLSHLRQGISLAVPRNVTTGSQGATLPVTVTNGLDQPVRVRLGLTPDNPRLVVEPTQVLTIAAGRRQQVNVPVTALANGLVRLQAQLLTPAGIPLSQPITVAVRVTQIGAVALALIAGLAALLFLVGILRLVRRLVLARMNGADADADADEAGTGESPGSAEVSEPADPARPEQDAPEEQDAPR